MRVAVPVSGDRFTSHFGQCDGVYLCDADLESGLIDRPRVLRRQTSGCESLPQWLAELAVQCVVAGGIGAGAQMRLAELGIQVSAGHQGQTPDEAVRHFLANPRAQLANTCAGHEQQHHHCRH
ncbi:MAG: NifB/NifX family molybdenum-iron cluster-binding protein [Phycisphaeraceae bacterium]